MRRLILLFALLLTAMQLNAQITVKGTVTSNEDGPMIGTGVLEKGTMNGTVTNEDGSYTITVSNGNAVLIFTTIGFKTVEVPVNNRAVINVTLEVDQQLLDELVVVGYSSKTRSEITSAVAVVNSEKLNDVVTSDISHMLQGKVAGVSVVNSSGLPGSSASIRIRGTSSLNAPQEPLYVVDGIIGGSYDPNDVESVTVLKDAGSTGMYGAQANGGVIVVTTKKAKPVGAFFLLLHECAAVAAAGRTSVRPLARSGFRRVALAPQPHFLLFRANDAPAAELLVVGDLAVGELSVLLHQDRDGHPGDAEGQQQDGKEDDFHARNALNLLEWRHDGVRAYRDHGRNLHNLERGGLLEPHDAVDQRRVGAARHYLLGGEFLLAERMEHRVEQFVFRQ